MPVLRAVLSLSSRELFVITVGLAWIAAVTLVCALQLHTNHAAIEQWTAARQRRHSSLGAAQEVSTRIEHFFNVSLDAIAVRRNELLGHIDDARRLLRERENEHRDQEAGDNSPKADGLADRWLQMARQRVMRRGCPKHRATASHFDEVLRGLNTRLELTADNTRRFNQLRDELRDHGPEVEELKALTARGTAAIQHMESKMARIASLWPRWFDELEGDAPIYRGLFAPDASVHPSHAEGLKEYLRLTGKQPAD
jgi:hypothetical protein